MNKDLTGLGDLDIEEIDRKQREELRARDPNNDAEVLLEMWTLAHLTRNGKTVRRVVYGVVTRCLTEDYMDGEIVCSPDLYGIPSSPNGARVYCSQWLRFECKGPGKEITIPEEELSSRLPDPDQSIADIKRRLEDREL